MKSWNRSARSFYFIIIAKRECDYWAVVFVLYARSQNTNDALMPGGIEQTQAVGGSRLSLLVRQVLTWQYIPQQCERTGMHVCFNFPPFTVERVKLKRYLQSIRFVVRDEAVNAKRHILQPSCGIQSRPQCKTQIVGGGTQEIALCNLQQGINSCAAASIANAPQSMMHENSIVIIEFHHIRYRA